MEEQFEKLRKDGKNTVDNIMKWMKDANITSPSNEDSIKKMFTTEKVELSKFKEVLDKISKDEKKPVEDLQTKLKGVGNQMFEALGAGASAVKDALAAGFK